MIRRTSCFLALALALFIILMSCIVSAEPPALVSAECDCNNIEVLQAELRNAVRLQQAFRNKIADLSKLGHDESQSALKQFAEGEARRGLEPITDYKGPKEFDYAAQGSTYMILFTQRAPIPTKDFAGCWILPRQLSTKRFKRRGARGSVRRFKPTKMYTGTPV